MIEVKKPTTILDVINGQKVTARRIDFEDGDQDHLWKESDRKATKEELTQAREDMETQIAGKADASDITTINETLAGKAEQSQVDALSSSLASKAEQSQVDTLSSSLASKAEQSEVDSLAFSVADKASQADLDTLTNEVGTKASQSALNSLASTVATKADQADLNTATGRIGTLESESATKEELEDSYEKTRMRNENLITNGFGELGDNTNFSQFEYDNAEMMPGDTSLGAFKIIGGPSVPLNDEYLPVNPLTPYIITMNYRAKTIDDTANKRFSFGFQYYDSDKQRMYGKNCPAPALSIEERLDGCILAQDFDTETDLTMHLQSGHAQKWLDRYAQSTTGPDYSFYPVRIKSRISSTGRDYGYEYLDYVAWEVWSIASVNVQNDTITFNSLLSTHSKVGAHIFKAGTKVDSTAFSGTFGWYFHAETILNNDNNWRSFSVDISKNLYEYAIRPATSFLKLVLLVNYGSNYSKTAEMFISAVSFKRNSTTPSMVSEQIETERPDSAYKNSEILVNDIPALPQSKITNLDTALAAKATNADLDITKADVSELQTSKASVLELSRTTNMDIYSNANLQSFIIGPAYSTATAFCTELGLFLEVRTPVWLSQSKIFMKDADNVLVQIYNYENDVVIYEKSFSLGANENIISLGVLLPAGRYYFSGTSDNESLAYFPTTSYSITHHFVSVFGGELDPVAFPAFMPGTTNQWAGFYQMTFQVPFKALYLGLLSAKEPNANLIQGAFYHVNDSNYLRTWCFDGTTQISN